MLDLLTFALSDYRCPHCARSLRFRLVKQMDAPPITWRGGVVATHCHLCPVCGGKIKADWHPAIQDDWLWGKRLAPGLLIWIAAMLMDFHPTMMMIGTVVLLIGFATVIHYMIAERWRRPYYVAFNIEQPEDTADTPDDSGKYSKTAP